MNYEICLNALNTYSMLAFGDVRQLILNDLLLHVLLNLPSLNLYNQEKKKYLTY